MKSILVFSLPGFSTITLKTTKVSPPLAAYLEKLEPKDRSDVVNKAVLQYLEKSGFDLNERGAIVDKSPQLFEENVTQEQPFEEQEKPKK